MMIYKFLNRENARCFTKRIFFAGYSIDTGYVTKINLKTSPICHNVKASPKTTVAQDHVCPHGSAFRQSRHTINLSNNWLTVIRWEKPSQKSLLFFILTYVCLLLFFYEQDIDLLCDTPKECNSIFQFLIPLMALHFFLHKYVYYVLGY